MSDETALVNVSDFGVQQYDDKVFDTIAASTFLPRLQLMAASAELCKKGQFPVNHYALIRNKTPEDLTSEVNVLVVCWRPKALDTSGESIVSFYKVESKEFLAVQAKADVKDSGCMFGPEFLVYIPERKVFASFFCGSKTARNEAPNIKALVGKAATFKSVLIETKKYSWQGIKVVACNTPFELPSPEELQKVATSFMNPKESEQELAEETEQRAR